MTCLRNILAGLALAFATVPAAAQDFVTVVSTTSTENSGIFGYILPIFQAKTGIEVWVVAQGTGQALETAKRGDADVVFVHARAAEESFVAEGWGVKRYDVMYNDFVVVGPSPDPAGVRGATDAVGAMSSIAAHEAPFASRGDDSGTHQAERALWIKADIIPAGDWYRATGSGMGATLNTAAEMFAYTLTDRGTWISFENKGGLTVLHEGDPALFNPYGVILVNPVKHPHVKAGLGQKFIDWLISPEGQQAIASYKIDGQQLFFPDARNGGLLPHAVFRLGYQASDFPH